MLAEKCFLVLEMLKSFASTDIFEGGRGRIV